ncbi:hypothetical protein BDN70DRAFT_925437, partial [Pholiota conissans]
MKFMTKTISSRLAPVFHSRVMAVPIIVDVAGAVEENSEFKSVSEEAEDEDEGEVEDDEAFDEADEVVAEVANATSTWDRPRKGILKITGQGTISVKADSTVGFHIEVQTVESMNPTLYLDVTQDECYFSYGGLPTADGGTLSSSAQVEFGKDAAKLSEGQGPYKHWLSIDLVNGVLRYGRGYCTASLVLLQAGLKKKEDKTLVYVDKWWEWVKGLQHAVVKQTGGHQLTDMVIDPFPL